MKDWTHIRERYLRDEFPIRLGGLAANLARIKSRSHNVANRALIASLMEESQLFIEWTIPDANLNEAAELSKLQVQLQEWQQISSLLGRPYTTLARGRTVPGLVGAVTGDIRFIADRIERTRQTLRGL